MDTPPHPPMTPLEAQRAAEDQVVDLARMHQAYNHVDTCKHARDLALRLRAVADKIDARTCILADVVEVGAACIDLIRETWSAPE